MQTVESPAVSVEELYAVYRTVVLNYCASRLRGDRAGAEDVTQEVFARALKYELRGDPRPWLFTVASHLIGAELKRRARSGTLREEALGSDHALDPEEFVVNRHLAQGLMETLTPRERAVIGHTLMSDQSHEATARMLGIRASTSRVLQSRALTKLRRISASGVASLALLVRYMPRRLRRAGDDWQVVLTRTAAIVAGGVALGLAVSVVSPGNAGKHAVPGSGTPTRLLQFADATASPASKRERLPLVARLSSAVTSTGPAKELLGLPLLGPPQPQNSSIVEVDPSPTFDQDKTIYYAGSDSSCINPCPTQPGVPTRSILFKSTDGGRSFAPLYPTTGYVSQGLKLVPGSGDRFFGYFPDVQVTNNGGAGWSVLLPRNLGFGLGVNWNGIQLVMADQTIVGVDGTNRSHVGASMPPKYAADGVPALIRVGAEDVLIQPLSLYEPASVSAAPPPIGDAVAVCSFSACGRPIELGVASTQGYMTIASPTVASDGTILVYSPQTSFVFRSTDSGRDFFPVELPRGLSVEDMSITNHGSGVRLAAALYREPGLESSYYSDDFGSTWHAARSAPGFQSFRPYLLVRAGAHTLIEDGQGLFAGQALAGTYQFSCSYDGGESWGPCGN